MNKVYLLLRNNQKSGPYRLEELIQLGLKPFDLVWIEGKSFSWSYPSEIGVLKPYVAQPNEPAKEESRSKEPDLASAASSPASHQAYLPQDVEKPSTPSIPTPKKIYVSMPGNVVQQPLPVPEKSPAADLEKKAEELRKRTQAYVPANAPKESSASAPKESSANAPKESIASTEPVQIKYSRAVGELEEEYSSWIYNQKSKNKNKKKLPWGNIATAVAAVLLLAVGFTVSKHVFSGKENVAKELTEERIPGNEALIPAENESSPPAQENTSPEKQSPEPAENLKQEPGNATLVSNTSSTVQKKESRVLPKQTAATGAVPTTKQVEGVNQNKLPAVEQGNNKEIINPTKSSPEAESETPKKKKTIGEALGSFFNKFKRKEDVKTDKPTSEEPKNTSQETRTDKPPVEKPQSTFQEAGTERKAKRRSDIPEADKPGEVITSTAPAEKINFEELIDISSNEPAEKWMLGVHGLKLTLRNRSNETVRTAAVEVRYYNEQNELLEKKVVNFTNIPPLKSATAPVPDHRLADHTDYRFLTASN